MSKKLCQSLLLVLLFTAGTNARRGGSSDGSSSDGGDDSSSSSGGSGGSAVCIETHELTTNDAVPLYELGVEVNGVPSETGAYYYGEATLQYTLLTGGVSNDCQGESRSVRMLGLAFVSSDVATNSSNPFTLGLKLWESSQPVSNITWSYSQCSPVDKLHLITTDVDWYGVYIYRQILDWWKVTVTPDLENPGAVAFEGAMTAYGVNATDDEMDTSEISNWMLLPGVMCDDEASQQQLGYGNSTSLAGTLTNDTLALTLTSDRSSRTFQRADYKYTSLTYSYSLTFSGIFDPVNSTRILTVSQNKTNTPLMSWSKNAGMRVHTTIFKPPWIWLLCSVLLWAAWS